MKYSLNVDLKETIGLEFSFSSITEGISWSSINITNQFLYSGSSKIQSYGGLLDSKLGWLGKTPCVVCKKDPRNCPGHFGFIKLYLPVFNIGYMKSVQAILQIVCKGCSRILIDPSKQKTGLINNLKNNHRNKEFDKIKCITDVIENSKKYTICPYCESKNGIIRKIGNFNFIHDIKFSKNHTISDDKLKNDKQILSNMTVLNPLKIFRILQKIKIEDLEFLEMDQINLRPENLMLTYIPVPPLTIRPSIFVGEKSSNEDDLTIKLSEIQQINFQMKKNLIKGVDMEQIIENWNMLQIECARYLDSEIFPKENNVKITKGLFQRLNGKNGRFRGNLSGKRVDFSARTVISPDPLLPLNTIGIPLQIALKLTFPERVNKINSERLQRAINRGAFRYPGANFFVDLYGKKIFLQDKMMFIKHSDLKEGFKVERHLKKNDIILFNRQPSLHRVSIMAHRVRIVPGKTFRFNGCVCKPYNADFDGDEMNIHVPQTQKSRAEAISLMNLALNITTSRNGELQVAPTQDFLSSSFMITSKDQFFSINSFGKLINFLDLKECKKTLPIPAIVKPIELWTGKQVFSWIIFTEHKELVPSKNMVDNMQTTEKIYSLTKMQCSPFICPYDGWVLFQKGELLSGRIGKNTIGSGDRSSFFSSLTSSHSYRYVVECMLRNSSLSTKWISEYGLSIGIDDINNKTIFSLEKNRLIQHGFNLCQSIHWILKKKHDIVASLESERERKIHNILGVIRDDIGKYCMDRNNLKNNSALAIVASGSKGSIVNLAQMISCLGQQSVNGTRIIFGMFGRTLPCFSFEHSKIRPGNNGFIESGLYEGLNSENFFFHAIAGREGLIDTAVKTSETGYLQRRLMKSLEDIVSFYDSSVRTSDGRLIQFKFGDDNTDPIKSSLMCNSTNKISRNLKKSIFFNKYFIKLFEADSFSKASYFCDIESFSFFNNLRNLFYSCYLTGYFKSFANFTEVELIFQKISKISSLSINDPGASVGAGAGQSIGEPGTQMTLQTFHFAGISNMNITMGVPRINEIMNASKSINSPVIRISLITMGKKKSILQTKYNLEKTFLGSFCQSIEIIIKTNQLKCKILFDSSFCSSPSYHISMKDIKKKIIGMGNIWNNKNVTLNETINSIEISFQNLINKKHFLCLEIVKLASICKNDLINLHIKGISESNKMILQNHATKSIFFLKNCNLIDVLNFPSIDRKTVYCNHIFSVFENFGIEAARTAIVIEIEATFRSHGISIDTRHISLLSDVMTFQGTLLGITRHGLAKMKSNTLVLASFEKTIENLFSAAVCRSKDEIMGVSESIILGKESPVGTGLVSLKEAF
nr:RNA polymerase III largest subunit [Cryptomonas sp.]